MMINSFYLILEGLLLESMGVDMLENMVGLLTNNNNIAMKLFCSCIELRAL